MNKERKIYFVVATGGHDTDQHYQDTIKNKRTLVEASKFLNPEEIKNLGVATHNRPFSVWGAVPGDRNVPFWDLMAPGDYLMIYRSGKIILAAEVAMKVRNPNYAKFLWKEDGNGKTWELMYFLINEIEVNVPIEKVNSYLGYGEKYFPRGFMAVDQGKANMLLSVYGDLISLLQQIEKGEVPQQIDFEKKKSFDSIVEEKVEHAPTEHDEMQWRLIRLGDKCKFDVWVPKADQGRSFQGNIFKNFVISDFHETLDVPTSIKNIDTVWKLGYSIKSAFEIEHSTSVYSGILRLSDLRALAPNSNFPLFIVASKERKGKVFQELQRPTFSCDYLHLDKVVAFLSYDKVRELDDNFKDSNAAFTLDWLENKAEKVKE